MPWRWIANYFTKAQIGGVALQRAVGPRVMGDER
jgi:hypothetical protein